MGRRSEGANGGVLFEALEPRLLLDGNVVASVVKGSLRITGDAGNNDITIAWGGGADSFLITGNSGTTVNGGAADTLTGVTKHVKINMKEGDDRVELDAVTIPKKLIAKTGLGNDTVIVNANCGRKATFKTGSGDDTIDVVNSNFYGNVVAKTGTGNDLISLDSIDFKKKTVAVMGSGDDSLSVTVVNFFGKVVAKGAGGDDTITIEQVDFRRKATFKTARGEDKVDIYNVDFFGKTVINTGGNNDQILTDFIDFNARLLVKAGAGDDYAYAKDCGFSGGLAHGGPGTDTYEDGGGNDWIKGKSWENEI